MERLQSPALTVKRCTQIQNAGVKKASSQFTGNVRLARRTAAQLERGYVTWPLGPPDIPL